MLTESAEVPGLRELAVRAEICTGLLEAGDDVGVLEESPGYKETGKSLYGRHPNFFHFLGLAIAVPAIASGVAHLLANPESAYADSGPSVVNTDIRSVQIENCDPGIMLCTPPPGVLLPHELKARGITIINEDPENIALFAQRSVDDLPAFQDEKEDILIVLNRESVGQEQLNAVLTGRVDDQLRESIVGAVETGLEQAKARLGMERKTVVVAGEQVTVEVPRTDVDVSGATGWFLGNMRNASGEPVDVVVVAAGEKPPQFYEDPQKPRNLDPNVCAQDKDKYHIGGYAGALWILAHELVHAGGVVSECLADLRASDLVRMHLKAESYPFVWFRLDLTFPSGRAVSYFVRGG